MGGKDGCYDNYMKWVHMAWNGCIIGNPSGCGHEDLLGDDTDDVVSSLSVIPNEIVSYIIHLVLLSDLTMLGTIHRVSETFRECATVDMTNRWPRLHLSEYVAEAPRLRPNIESTVSVRRFMRETLPGSGAACRLREFLVGNTQWYNAWITMTPESFCWYRIIDIFWRRRR